MLGSLCMLHCRVCKGEATLTSRPLQRMCSQPTSMSSLLDVLYHGPALSALSAHLSLSQLLVRLRLDSRFPKPLLCTRGHTWSAGAQARLQTAALRPGRPARQRLGRCRCWSATELLESSPSVVELEKTLEQLCDLQLHAACRPTAQLHVRRTYAPTCASSAGWRLASCLGPRAAVGGETRLDRPPATWCWLQMARRLQPCTSPELQACPVTSRL